MKKCFTALSSMAAIVPAFINFMSDSILLLLAGAIGMGMGLLSLYIAVRCFEGVIGALLA